MLTTQGARRIVAAAALALVLVAGGCAGNDQPDVDVGLGEGDDTSTTTETAPSPSAEDDGPPPSAEEIVAMIDRAAEGMGEPEPTDVMWVYSTRSAANLLISESVVGAGEEDVDVLVVQARGDFTVEGTSGPPDEETGQTAPAPTGSVLNVVLDATSGHLLDVGVRHVAADLAQLGEVHRVS